MNSSSVKIWLASALVLMAVIVALPITGFAKADPKQQEITYRYLETFANVLSILQENYVEEIEAKEAIEGAINGLLLSLDPHSAYLKPENYREFRNETNGSFTGIGIRITLEDGVITVIAPIADTPADRAGIKAHDKIIKIDGEPTKGKTPFDAVKIMRGPQGTEVTLSIYRDGWESSRDFTMRRSEIPLLSVKSLLLKPGFGYLRISNFQRNTTNELTTHIEELQKTSTLRGLILDLRNNPGGLLDQAVSVSDLFLEEGLIVYTRGRNKDQDLTFEAKANNTLDRFPLVLLVNEGTASASEIVAGAVQDHRRGVIVGTNTFGKGSVQSIIPLNDGAGLKMTTAHYYTPSGRTIQVTGITPDVTVKSQNANLAKADESNNLNSTREADLENHFSSQTEGSEAGADDDALSAEASERLGNDNQLQAAFDILTSLALYAAYDSETVEPVSN
ncbi:MAG: S41 family peptidase [Desulfofustis sp.]|nr:S41 family peptidase [Desulfofustis sp.]